MTNDRTDTPRHPTEDAERTLVGSVLVHPQIFIEVCSEVAPGDFWHPALGAIWGAFVGLDRAQRPIDQITVIDYLRTTEQVDKLNLIGGKDALTWIAADVAGFENIAYHARRVAQMGRRRRWGKEMARLAAEAQDLDRDVDDYFNDAEPRVLRLMQNVKSEPTVFGVYEGMFDAIARAEKRYDTRNDPRPKGVRIGIHRFDRITCGLGPGELVVIAARTGHGKSSLAGLVLETTTRDGMPSLTFALEMMAPQYFDRLLVAGAGVDANRFRSGHLETHDFIQLNRVAAELASPKLITIDHEPGLRIGQMRARARRWRAGPGRVCQRCAEDRIDSCPHAVVVVDYMQLAHGDGGSRSRQEEVAEVSRGHKELAKEVGCPVVALAQINRGPESRENKRPTIADIRDSGQLELDADIIAFIYREEEANPECSPDLKGTAELIIGKGRDVSKGSIPMLFEGKYRRFRNPPPKDKHPNAPAGWDEGDDD